MATFIEIMRNAILVGIFLTILAAAMILVSRFLVGNSADRRD